MKRFKKNRRSFERTYGGHVGLSNHRIMRSFSDLVEIGFTELQELDFH